MNRFSIKDVQSFLENSNIEYEYSGNCEKELLGFSAFNNYEEGTVTWIRGMKDAVDRDFSKLSLAIVPNDFFRNYDNFIYTENPRYVFFLLIKYFEEKNKKTIKRRGDNISIADNAEIDESVIIGNCCTIGENVKIAKNTIIEHNVVLENAIIGERVTIKSGSIVGGRGFGYVKGKCGYVPIIHTGRVLIGNDVEIGSNVCIDRGTMGDTIIEDGVKIDNLCHIAHNVHIKKNSMIIAQSMIGGSAEIGEDVYIAPGSLIKDHQYIGNNSVVGMGTVVLEDVSKNEVVIGVPAKKLRKRTEEDYKLL